MRRSFFVLAMLASGVAFAQAPQGRYFVVHQEQAKPSMLKEYEGAQKEFVATSPRSRGCSRAR